MSAQAASRNVLTVTRMRLQAAGTGGQKKKLPVPSFAGEPHQSPGKLGDQSRKAMEAGYGNLAEEADTRRGAAQEQLADLRRMYTDMQAEEQRITAASQRLQAPATRQ